MSSSGATKNTSAATAKNSSSECAAYGSRKVGSSLSTALGEMLVLIGERIQPDAALARRVRRFEAGGDAAAHVDHVRELMDDDVVAIGRREPGIVDVAPGEHDRAAAHRLAGELLVEGVHDAVLVFHFAPRDDRVLVDDDADEAAQPVEAQLQGRQAGLRGDGDGHRVSHLEAAYAGEFLLGEKERCHLAQLGDIGFVACAEERIARERELPERVGNRPALERAPTPPASPPAGHAGSGAVSGAIRARPCAVQRSTWARGTGALSRSQSLST